MGERDVSRRVAGICFMLVFKIIGLIVVGFIVLLALALSATPPARTVTITGVDGLDDVAAGRPLTPVLNLTFRIGSSGDESGWSGACITGPSTAVVSYGDAFLGKATVPEFCDDGKQGNRRSVTAWGRDVELPGFLRERLAGELERGEAEVDVQVTMTAECYTCGNQVLRCKAKIGGGACACWQDRNVFFPPAPGTESLG